MKDDFEISDANPAGARNPVNQMIAERHQDTGESRDHREKASDQKQFYGDRNADEVVDHVQEIHKDGADVKTNEREKANQHDQNVAQGLDEVSEEKEREGNYGEQRREDGGKNAWWKIENVVEPLYKGPPRWGHLHSQDTVWYRT